MVTKNYRDSYARSLEKPEAFWLEAAGKISWSTPPQRALDSGRAPLYDWFPDGVLNTSYNALDRHVEEGRGGQDALIYDSAMLGTQRRYSYAELTDLVARFAGVLRSQGVGKGDRVVIYMPMIPEAAIAMLATARLGAVHSVVFGGFAPKELAARIRDAAPAAVVTASGGIEPSRRIEYLPAVEEALGLAGAPDTPVLVKARDGFASSVADHAGWLDWDTEMATAAPAAPVDVKATDPLYILYTSGTTGAPKGVVRDNGGHAVALSWTLENIYDIGPGDVMWTASDVGWVVGHSYIVYGPAAGRRHDRPLRRQARGHARRRGVLAGDRGPQGQRAVHRAHRPAGHPEGRPRGRSCSKSTTFPACAPCLPPANGWTPTPSTGPRGSWASRWWTTGGRPRPAGPSAPTRAGWTACRSRPARPACRCPASS